MKPLHFSKTFFNKLIFDEPDSNVRVVVKETPCSNIKEEEYSLRITTRHEDGKIIGRDCAIEHSLPPSKHAFPHVQFKFHAEEIGQFRIRVDFENQEEYKKGVLGFIYKIKSLLSHLEIFREGITNEVLVLDLVDKLEEESKFLTSKMCEGIMKYSAILDEEEKRRVHLEKLNQNKLLLGFIGISNVKLIEDSYNEIKKKEKWSPKP